MFRTRKKDKFMKIKKIKFWRLLINVSDNIKSTLRKITSKYQRK